MDKKKVSILGAAGYAGVELFRLLYSHPRINIYKLSSVSFEGQELSSVYKNLGNINNYKLVSQDEAIESADVVFAALPHGLSEAVAQQCKGKIFIDLGADFRLNDEAGYKKWYGNDFAEKSLHEYSVYGLTELNREKIRGAKIIGNPGCYPTSIALGLYPLLKNKIIGASIIADCKSGVTGAGRAVTQTTHFTNCNEAFAPYKLAMHRHTPEIEETLSYMYSGEVRVTFVPHLLPVNRGILSTIYCDNIKNYSLSQIYNLYTDFYKDEFFVRVLPLGGAANISNITHSNFCDISLHVDEHTNRIIVVSAIDNMIKGAAGQAIQNMNICLGFDEKAGLELLPPAF
ncbi:MAG: N-acetyl-gamma-glutamyl-phosphate reductase [Clostridiales bacterium]|jgi:N-acetyl-gamma-glutamyl-phosphate reductase|nr:N-acetyl-gamma-glutamyl-phosphate reductase [Clostridiales bacterium]